MLDLSPWQQCQGIAALESWVSRYRRPTFLRRNLRSVLDTSTMKKIQSRSNINVSETEDEEPIIRPVSKRRRHPPQNTSRSRSSKKQIHNRHKIDNLISGIGSDLSLKIEIGPIWGQFPAAISMLGGEDTTTYRSRCIVTIYQRERRENHHGKLVPFDERLDGHTQDCEIELTRDGMAKVSIPEPFIFGKQSLLVDVIDQRRINNSLTKSGIRPSMSVTCGLAEQYVVAVKFEKPRGPVEAWPPFALETEATGIVEKLLNSESWTSRKVVLQSTISEVLKPHLGSGSASTDISLSIGTEKQRTKLKLDYNIAWSTPPKIHNHFPRLPPSVSNGKNSLVTYEFEFPTEGLNIRSLDSLKCIFCRKSHQFTNELLFHLGTTHDEFFFQSQPCTNELMRISIREASSRDRKYRESHLDRVFRLNRPRQQFDLERYLAGDNSWILSRINNKYLQSYRQSRSSNMVVPQPERYRVKVVPNKYDSSKTKLAGPFYTTITKEILIPGDSLTAPSTDEDWLFKKHVDTLNDYSDVTAAEKEYLTRWDRFIMPQKLTANIYVAAALERFVRIEPEWFIGNEQRLAELGKHCTMFLVRGVIDIHCVRRVLEVASGRDRENVRRENLLDTN